ncbi:MAG: hypothetical protein ACOCV1_02405 [Bacillota bacterium]
MEKNLKLKSYSTHFNESILDPIRDSLSSDLWDDNMKLKPKVKKQILDIFNQWAEKIQLKIKPKNFHLVGSMAGYQYNEYSDVDIMVEIKISDERLKRIKKILPNGNDLKGTNHPINYFIYTGEDKRKNVQLSVYDILSDQWIKKPEKPEEDSDQYLKTYYFSSLNQALSWARKISLDIEEIKRLVLELKMFNFFLEQEEFLSDDEFIKNLISKKKMDIKAAYDVIVMDLYMLKQFRDDAYPSGGENPFVSRLAPHPDNIPHPDYSVNNIIYKILEKFGYLDQLKQAKVYYKKKYPEMLDIKEK